VTEREGPAWRTSQDQFAPIGEGAWLRASRVEQEDDPMAVWMDEISCRRSYTQMMTWKIILPANAPIVIHSLPALDRGAAETILCPFGWMRSSCNRV
jgi:hypothetical protein